MSEKLYLVNPMDSIQNALVTDDRSRDYLYTNQKMADFTSI